jgi:AbrB family looped-hinge helix DNA binding protein
LPTANFTFFPSLSYYNNLVIETVTRVMYQNSKKKTMIFKRKLLPFFREVFLLKRKANLSWRVCKESKEFRMEIARVTSKGQITIPRDIREKMNIKKGDKIVFFEDNGTFYMQNASSIDLKKLEAGVGGKLDPQH